MITFRVRGRTVSVLYSEANPPPTDPELSVFLDDDWQLPAEYVFCADLGATSRIWLVHLPDELYQGCPRRVAVHVKSGGRLLGTKAFSFAGSQQIVRPVFGKLVLDPDSTHFDAKKTDIDVYGEDARAALSIDRSGADVLFFSIIDWDYRIQRPQHLARRLAEAGHRVFYISVHFGDYADAGRFRIVQQLVPRVFEVQLLVSAKINRIYGGFTADHVEQLRDAVLDLHDTMG